MVSGDRPTDEDVGLAVEILFVDDDPNQREMYQRRLERKGYQVEVADSADAAVERLRQWRPMVIVLDIAMPGRDGLSALQEFLDIDPSVPVIINTAYPGYAENFLSWAADAYIEKSADLEPLVEAIETAVQRRLH
ncbi:MAG: response regulator [candidate division WS1 bacterium]|jgi:DNA-binding NtrC family response regulator|nr:response regulator [candidate division WS1 bacterium]